MTPKCSIGIVDSYILIGCSFKHVLQNVGLDVILQANNAEDFFKQSENAIPDICLLNIDVPDISKFFVAKHIKDKYPDIKILAYTLFEQDYKAAQIKQYGIDVFLKKSCSPEQIKTIISDL